MSDRATYRTRLLASLDRQHLLQDTAGAGTTIYQQPAWRSVDAGHEPQRLMDANRRQRDLVICAHATPATGENLCAAWVERAFDRLGICSISGNAPELYHSWCHETDTSRLLVGMIAATPTHPYGSGGRAWGHVGLYVGDEQIMDCVAGKVRTLPCELWISAYGVMAEVRWGWLGGIALDELD